MNNDQKSNKLLDLLSQLADDNEYTQKDNNKEMQQLIEIYSNGFHHSYGKISAKVQFILEEDSVKGECLLQNLQTLQENIEKLDYNKKIPSEISGKVRNLYNYINLEVGRYNLTVREIEKRIQKLQMAQESGASSGVSNETFNNKIQEIDKRVEKMVDQSYDVTRELEKVDGKLERNSMSSITTLTIFSAVILAFTGSVTFASGVFSGMSHVSSYRIVFVAAMIGEVVFNLIFMLLFIIGKIVGRNIYCQCSYFDEESRDEVKKCGMGWCSRKRHIPNVGCVLLHKYPYIFFVNLILVLIMYYDLILFFINHPGYIAFIYITSVARCVLLFLPVIVIVLIFLLYQIEKHILYCRTVNAISLVLAEEYFNRENQNMFTNIVYRLAEWLRRFSSPHKKQKTEIEDILENMPNGTNTEKYEYVIKELKNISRLKLIKGNRNFIVISYAEDKYNKSQLSVIVRDILDRYSKFDTIEEMDETVVDVE